MNSTIARSNACLATERARLRRTRAMTTSQTALVTRRYVARSCAPGSSLPDLASWRAFGSMSVIAAQVSDALGGCRQGTARPSALISTAAGRPLRVTVMRSCCCSTRSTISENFATTCGQWQRIRHDHNPSHEHCEGRTHADSAPHPELPIGARNSAPSGDGGRARRCGSPATGLWPRVVSGRKTVAQGRSAMSTWRDLVGRTRVAAHRRRKRALQQNMVFDVTPRYAVLAGLCPTAPHVFLIT